jgi:hypothetical protein
MVKINKLNTGISLQIFGIGRDEIRGNWIKPDNKKLNGEYCLLECDAV